MSETSLARLDDHQWQILSNTWARGVDWYVRKIGRKWTPIDVFGTFPLTFQLSKTERELVDKLTAAYMDGLCIGYRAREIAAEDKGETL